MRLSAFAACKYPNEMILFRMVSMQETIDVDNQLVMNGYIL